MKVFGADLFTGDYEYYIVLDRRGAVLGCEHTYDDAVKLARRPHEILTVRAWRMENGRLNVTDTLYRDQKYFGTHPTLDFVPMSEVVAQILRFPFREDL